MAPWGWSGRGADAGSQKAVLESNTQISSSDTQPDRAALKDAETLPQERCFRWRLKGKPFGGTAWVPP